MLQNAYFLAKIGADTAENEQHFAENLPKIGNYPTASASSTAGGRSSAAAASGGSSASVKASASRKALLKTKAMSDGQIVFWISAGPFSALSAMIFAGICFYFCMQPYIITSTPFLIVAICPRCWHFF